MTIPIERTQGQAEVHSRNASVPFDGLSSEDARERLGQGGFNELTHTTGPSPWRLLASQFESSIIWILLAACGLSALLGDRADAIAIAAIILVNTLVGFFQEYRAENALLALRSLSAPRARVMRDGRAVELPAREVVAGDLLLLEAGDVVAADARLHAAHALATGEALLTGESAPVQKVVGSFSASAPLAERKDCVFAGTSVLQGTGSAVVSATGMNTELGKIAGLLANTEVAETPLTKQLQPLSKLLLILSLVAVMTVAALGLSRGTPWLELLMSSVALAVAAVPEGLAAIITVALAIGVQRMATRNVLVRKLPSIEALGSTSVICTDKTGTLTTGVMTVRELWGPSHQNLLAAAAACCDAELGSTTDAAVGDPTEVALLRAARERGIDRPALERDRPRVAVHPFDADRKRMSVLRSDGVLYVKGALESIASLCGDQQLLRDAVSTQAEMAARGLRVLAVAVGSSEREEDLTLLGLVGMADPPRTEAVEAVRQARAAGIRTVMITGDHPITATAIARELGILAADEEAADVVHARATPEDKLRIVRGWKQRGAIVAMTGDGVNDAPALREAHIGIAMGKAGTEVTREAADMILTDDNFASIVAGVREGRATFDNIQKTLVYLLPGNIAELLVMLGASIMGLHLPLTALQLLWINLVTESVPALALVADPPAPDVLSRPPRPAGAALLGASEWRRILAVAALQAAVTLSVFIYTLSTRDLASARNMAFSTLVFGELFRAFSARTWDRPFWTAQPLGNVLLLVVVSLSVLLQIGVHHMPFTQRLFEIGDISLRDCALSFALGLIPFVLLELFKTVRWVGRRGLDTGDVRSS